MSTTRACAFIRPACLRLLLAAAITVPVLAGAPEVLTLSQAVHEALDHNDRIVDARDRLEQANLSLHLANSAFRPKIVPNVQGSFGQTDVANQNYRLDVTDRLTTGTEFRAGIGASSAQIPSAIAGDPDIRYYYADTTFEISQPMLRGFGPSVAKRGQITADLQRGDAIRQIATTEQTLAVDVAQAYYRLVAMRSVQRVGTKSLERAHQLVESTKARLAAGIVSQLDELRAEQLVLQADLQMSDVDASLEDARAELTYLMGRPADSSFDVIEDIPPPGEVMSAADALAVAFEKRGDLLSLEAAAADSTRALAFSRNQLLPELDVNLLLTRRDTARTFADSFRVGHFQFATFFAVSLPVDRTSQIVDYQNALIERDRRDRAIETLRRTIADDVRRAVRDRERLRRNIDVAVSASDLARKSIEVAEYRYEHALSNNLDLVGAESDWLSAESRRISALADAALADLRFRALIGALDPRKEP